MKKKMFFGMLAGVLTLGLVLTGCEKANPETDFVRRPNGRVGVTITGYAGQSETVVIPSRMDGKPVTAIGERAFLGCIGLTSVSIPGRVTGIGEGAFSGCTGLMSVSIPGSVTSIGDMAFNSCTGLTSVTIQNGVTSIGEGAFWGCTGLTSVSFGSGSNIVSGNFGTHAFPEGSAGYGSDGLKKAYLASVAKVGTYSRTSTSASAWTKD
jgi:hypothetical protein